MKPQYLSAFLVIILLCVSGFYFLNDSSSGELSLPSIDIDTDGERIESREEYVICTVNVEDPDDIYDLSGSGKVRGRGNSSWEDMEKKSYKIKFDSDTDLFGMGAAKEYCLISNYKDPSLIRNLLAYDISAVLGLENTTKSQCVNLYLNGIYEGMYLLCEQTEVYANRVDTSADYLVEMDQWQSQRFNKGTLNVDYFVASDGKDYSIEYPDPYKFNSTELNDIKTDLNNIISKLRSGNWLNVISVIDAESFAKTYIVHELFNNRDVGVSSFYLYSLGGKMYCGPIWDLDYSSGNSREYDVNPETIYVPSHNPWYGQLVKYAEFQDMVGTYLTNYESAILQTISDDVRYVFEHKYDFEHNFDRWTIIGMSMWPNPVEFILYDSWGDHVNYLENWLKKSLTFLLETYP